MFLLRVCFVFFSLVLVLIVPLQGMAFAQASELKVLGSLAELYNQGYPITSMVMSCAPVDESGIDIPGADRYVLIQYAREGEYSAGFALYKTSYASNEPITRILIIPISYTRKKGRREELRQTYRVNGIRETKETRVGQFFDFVSAKDEVRIHADWITGEILLKIHQNAIPELNTLDSHGQKTAIRCGWRIDTTVVRGC